jgi:hypothetical protein
MDAQQNSRVSALYVFAAVVLSVHMDGQTPLASDPYVPLSVGEKAATFAKRNIAPESLGKSAFTAAINQLQNSPAEWGQGMAGYGRRYGSKLANRGMENSIGLLVAAPLHQDPRYFHSGETGLRRRSRHALGYTFMTRKDSGARTFSTWRFAGNYGSHFVSNAWRPERQTQIGDTLLRGTVSVGYDAASNLFKEFWPDIRKRVFHR